MNAELQRTDLKDECGQPRNGERQSKLTPVV